MKPIEALDAAVEVVASLDGTQYSDVRICGNPPATSGIVCTVPTDSIGVAFTYGDPFELSVALDGVAGGGLDYANISGGGTLDYSLPSDTDVLTTFPASTVPEPASAFLTIAGISMLLIRKATHGKVVWS